MRGKASKYYMRSQTASSAVELVCVILVFIPLALLGVNICSLCLAGFINDEASKEAARAAAQQSSGPLAKYVAEATVQSFAIATGLFSSPRVTGVQYQVDYGSDPENPTPTKVIDLSTGDGTSQNPGNLNLAPNVAVTTQLTATTPAPILFGEGGLTSQVTLSNTTTFPIVGQIDPEPDEEDPTGGDNSQPPRDNTADPDYDTND